jgi:hypothetical protein
LHALFAQTQGGVVDDLESCRRFMFFLNTTLIIDVERQSRVSLLWKLHLFLVLRQTSLTGKEKCHSTIPFEREAEESRNCKLRMIDIFTTKASMTTVDVNTVRLYKADESRL